MNTEQVQQWTEDLSRVLPTIIGTAGGLILIAVFLNFLAARPAAEVAEQKKSPVATATMILFFVVLYELVHLRIGAIRSASAPVVFVSQILGIAMLVKGALMNLIGRFYLGLNWANQATVYEEQRLVTHGLYRFVRHPLYSGLILFGAGVSVAYLNWLALVLVLVVFRSAMAYRAEIEEAMLQKRFPEYTDFRARTGRFFPRLAVLDGYRPLEVSRDGFRFCRYSMATLVWVGVVLRLPWLVLFCAAVMAVSAIVTVRQAPMVMLYGMTVERFRPSPKEVVDANGLRLAHIVAACALSIPIGLIAWPGAIEAEDVWRFLVLVAMFKTLGTLGFCPVSRMFTCMIGGGSCCRFLGAFQRRRPAHR